MFFNSPSLCQFVVFFFHNIKFHCYFALICEKIIVLLMFIMINMIFKVSIIQATQL